MESQWKELQLDVVGEFEFVQTGITLLNKELPE